MTKLLQWLTGVCVFLSIWYYVVSHLYIPSPWDFHAWLIPVYAVLLFGVISAAIVLWRTFSFNDCPDASKELKEEIERAKQEMRRKGIIKDYHFHIH